MAFLDKFNVWYVKLIPESGPGVSVEWWEPPAAARYRWKQGFNARLTWLMIIFLFVLMVPSRRGSDPSFETRLLIAPILTGGYALLAWLFRNASRKIFLAADRVVIGAGSRGAKRIRLDKAHAVILGDVDGHRVLLVCNTPDESERIYLNPYREDAVRELLAKGGWPQAVGGRRTESLRF